MGIEGKKPIEMDDPLYWTACSQVCYKSSRFGITNVLREYIEVRGYL